MSGEGMIPADSAWPVPTRTIDVGAWANDVIATCADKLHKPSGYNPEVHVPGQWRCAKCGFVLLQSNLNMADDTITARNDGGEHCPNDGAPLWRVTWKELATDQGRHIEELFERARSAEERLARLAPQSVEG